MLKIEATVHESGSKTHHNYKKSLHFDDKTSIGFKCSLSSLKGGR